MGYDIKYISIVIPTYRHAWEIEKVLFSLEEKQLEISPIEYEIIVVNDDPLDKETLEACVKYYKKFRNVRYIEVPQHEQNGIKNAGRSGNIGARQYAKGDLLILMVDSARIVTPRAIARTRDTFRRIGPDICTTVYPYHIGRYYFDKSYTPEMCKRDMEKIRWQEDPYRLQQIAAHTFISKTGNINESTFHGITKENFLKVGGWNEDFKGWGLHNIDLWRRCVYPPPLDSKQEIDVPGKWGKIGLGLDPVNLEGEATYHIHHDVTVPRVLANIKADTNFIWKKYTENKECIIVNTSNPGWGYAKDSEEINLEEF